MGLVQCTFCIGPNIIEIQCMYCTIGRPVQLIFSPMLLNFDVHPFMWHILGSQYKHLFKK
jgi:hypothetical protein